MLLLMVVDVVVLVVVVVVVAVVAMLFSHHSSSGSPCKSGRLWERRWRRDCGPVRQPEDVPTGTPLRGQMPQPRGGTCTGSGCTPASRSLLETPPAQWQHSWTFHPWICKIQDKCESWRSRGTYYPHFQQPVTFINPHSGYVGSFRNTREMFIQSLQSCVSP